MPESHCKAYGIDQSALDLWRGRDQGSLASRCCDRRIRDAVCERGALRALDDSEMQTNRTVP